MTPTDQARNNVLVIFGLLSVAFGLVAVRAASSPSRLLAAPSRRKIIDASAVAFFGTSGHPGPVNHAVARASP